jgi:hypothetical protein
LKIVLNFDKILYQKILIKMKNEEMKLELEEDEKTS